MSEISYRCCSPRDLWYPSLIVPLSSPAGQNIFSESFHIAYNHLNPNFEPQEHISFCGIACACIILNTVFPSKKWCQSKLYSNIAQVYMLNGITLTNLSHVLEICSLPSIIRYCDDDKIIEKQFREDLKEQKYFIIVNYWRQFHVEEKDYIHQGGHFSLIGGFNENTDDVLILDTNPTRFPHHWLPLKDLVRMMCTFDRMASMPRGYLIVIHSNEFHTN